MKRINANTKVYKEAITNAHNVLTLRPGDQSHMMLVEDEYLPKWRETVKGSKLYLTDDGYYRLHCHSKLEYKWAA